MSSYENAPATRMLATHCACCGRPLVDAKSVECGVGPECRKRHGYDIDLPEDVRKEANRIVYEIACEQEGHSVVEKCALLRQMGLDALASRIIQRLRTVSIQFDGEEYIVQAPYEPDAVRALARIPGRKWHGDGKFNTFPATQKRQLWDVLQRYYAGFSAIGPKGAFVIE
jgi:hypothetical protein